MSWTVYLSGEIHTDFERGFIRAEVIAYDDYIAGNGEQGAKEAGKWRLEGKEYVVVDGDIMHVAQPRLYDGFYSRSIQIGPFNPLRRSRFPIHLVVDTYLRLDR